MSIAKFDLINSKKLATLVELVHLRWALPILAEIWLEQGAKFVLLANRLGISRDALSRTLSALIEMGLVEKNPVHGHPLRPEYFLTIEGEGIAPAVSQLLKFLRERGLEETCLNKWSLPIVWVLSRGELRFSELQQIPRISPRALALSLADLEATQLIAKTSEGTSKRMKYHLTPQGQEVVSRLEELSSGLGG